ncbi:MAG: FHA domain-containing protein [Acidobacteriota bacterium]|nr:FHA domain-containing protein [Acidobacteriota bacterium]
MNQSFMALALQGTTSDSYTWIIIAVVLVVLFLIVAIVVIGLTIFFVMRRRSKAQKVPATSAMGPSDTAYAGMSQRSPEITPVPEPSAAALEAAAVTDSPPPALDATGLPQNFSEAASAPDTALFDPTRTVAIVREETVTVDYGRIKFTSGALAGEEFAVDPEGAYIGRESTLSQIVVSDPRISKRHLWIGVRDGAVKIEDQDSRNGTFLNDPKSERVKEATLNSGDTVILGESDVARFEYHL